MNLYMFESKFMQVGLNTDEAMVVDMVQLATRRDRLVVRAHEVDLELQAMYTKYCSRRAHVTQEAKP